MCDEYEFEVDYEEELYSHEDMLREKVRESLRKNGMVFSPTGKWHKIPPQASSS